MSPRLGPNSPTDGCDYCRLRMVDDTDEQSVAPSATTGSRARKSQLTTEHLLEAAVAVFGERGFEKARVSDIARRCGLSSGAAFSRWPTKEDLFCASVEFVSSRQYVLSVAETDVSMSDMVAALGERLLGAEGAPHRDLMLEARAIARRNPELRHRLSEAFGSEVGAVERVISEGQREGMVDGQVGVGALVLLSQALDVGTHLVMSTNPDGAPEVTSAEWNELIRRMIAAVQPSAAE